MCNIKRASYVILCIYDARFVLGRIVCDYFAVRSFAISRGRVSIRVLFNQICFFCCCYIELELCMFWIRYCVSFRILKGNSTLKLLDLSQDYIIRISGLSI